MDENSVKVNCDYCEKEMECPKDMLQTSKSHMCHECFSERVEKGSNEELKDVHVDFPTEDLIEKTANTMVNEMVEEVFSDIWNSKKSELKEMSKKDAAYEMFGAGAYIALSNVLKIQHMQARRKEKGLMKKVLKPV